MTSTHPDFRFELLARCPSTRARVGRFHTPHGALETPAFMPVGTRGSVKGLTPEQVASTGTRMLLGNTYHLALRPGSEVVRELGGLARFMAWDGPTLTDSGGYQVFSLGHLARIDESGVRLRSVIDGSPFELSPERAIEIQLDLGADVVMAFDHCAPDPLDRIAVEAAAERTARWLERCVARWRQGPAGARPQALFGIVQGGAFPDLRARSLAQVTAFDLPGYAVGGVSVGEHDGAMELAVASATPGLPEDRPRYLMGVGTRRHFAMAIAHGIDLFDCVTPTRHGRNHQAYVGGGRVNLRNQRFARDPGPLDPECDCPVCARYSRGYLRHLCNSGEMLAGTLLSWHNLRTFQRWMETIRSAIQAGDFARLAQDWRRPETAAADAP